MPFLETLDKPGSCGSHENRQISPAVHANRSAEIFVEDILIAARAISDIVEGPTKVISELSIGGSASLGRLTNDIPCFFVSAQS
jgi:hypothetical protein